MSNTDLGPMLAALDEADRQPSTITLPMPGADGTTRDYVIGEGTGAEMLRLWTVQSVYRRARAGLPPSPGDAEIIDGMSQRQFMEMSLGVETTERVLADGVPMDVLRLAIEAASAFRLGDVDAARAVWSGKAPSPKTRSARTGDAGSGTRRASTSGTNTRRKSKSV